MPGQFTQEDPIGLAGGVNLFGFAGGDPVNFSDPLGLCPTDDCQPTEAERAVQAFRQWAADAFNRSIAVAGAVGNWIRREGPGIVAEETAFAAVGPIVGAIRNSRRIAAVSTAARRFLSENRHFRNAAAAQHDWSRVGLTADQVLDAVLRNSGWETAEHTIAGRTMSVGGVNVGYSIFRNSESPGEWVLNAWIR